MTFPLPRDITHNYLCPFLDVKTFGRYCQVNRSFSSIFDQKTIWDSFLRRDFNLTSSSSKNLYEFLVRYRENRQLDWVLKSSQFLELVSSFPASQCQLLSHYEIRYRLRPTTFLKVFYRLISSEMGYFSLTLDESDHFDRMSYGARLITRTQIFVRENYLNEAITVVRNYLTLEFSELLFHPGACQDRLQRIWATRGEFVFTLGRDNWYPWQEGRVIKFRRFPGNRKSAIRALRRRK